MTTNITGPIFKSWLKLKSSLHGIASNAERWSYIQRKISMLEAKLDGRPESSHRVSLLFYIAVFRKVRQRKRALEQQTITEAFCLQDAIALMPFMLKMMSPVVSILRFYDVTLDDRNEGAYYPKVLQYRNYIDNCNFKQSRECFNKGDKITLEWETEVLEISDQDIIKSFLLDHCQKDANHCIELFSDNYSKSFGSFAAALSLCGYCSSKVFAYGAERVHHPMIDKIMESYQNLMFHLFNHKRNKKEDLRVSFRCIAELSSCMSQKEWNEHIAQNLHTLRGTLRFAQRQGLVPRNFRFSSDHYELKKSSSSIGERDGIDLIASNPDIMSEDLKTALQDAIENFGLDTNSFDYNQFEVEWAIMNIPRSFEEQLFELLTSLKMSEAFLATATERTSGNSNETVPDILKPKRGTDIQLLIHHPKDARVEYVLEGFKMDPKTKFVEKVIFRVKNEDCVLSDLALFTVPVSCVLINCSESIKLSWGMLNQYLKLRYRPSRLPV